MHIKIFVITVCLSVSSGRGYKGKVKKYFFSFSRVASPLGQEKRANLSHFFGFREVLFMRFPYLWLF